MEEGDTFRGEDDDQVNIKTDEDGGCCLDSGVIRIVDDDEVVIKVACEYDIAEEE